MTLRCSMIVYDVPQKSEAENPSRFMRRRAYRINLSCWVVPDHLVPYAYLGELTEQGVRWRLRKFDPSESEAIVAEAQELLSASVADATKRYGAGLMSSAERNALDDDRRDRHAMASEARLHEAMDDAALAAQGFGCDVSDAIATAAKHMETLSRLAEARAAAVRKLVQDIVGTEMHAQAADDRVPVGILADYAEDRSLDASDVRRTFA